MKAIAEWLASKPTSTTSGATTATNGAALYQSKTCVACHGADAKTPLLPIYPKLAGQNKDYALAQQ